MLTSRITEGENRHFKTNTDHHNGDLIYVFFFFNYLDKHDYIWNLTQGELSIINASFIFFHPLWPDSHGYMILMPSDLISRQALELLRPSSVPSTNSTDLPNPMMVPQARIFSFFFFFHIQAVVLTQKLRTNAISRPFLRLDEVHMTLSCRYDD